MDKHREQTQLNRKSPEKIRKIVPEQTQNYMVRVVNTENMTGTCS